MNEGICISSGAELADTDFGYTLSLVSGKYKLIIMYWLTLGQPVMRFNELHRALGAVSFRTLSRTLKEMEADGLLLRTEYPQIPPKVEYSLTDKGRSLMPLISLLCDWGRENRPPQE